MKRRVQFFKTTMEPGELTGLQAEINKWFSENVDKIDDGSLKIVQSLDSGAFIVAIYWRERKK